MAQPVFPNERMVDVYKALELEGQFDYSSLEDEIQNEGVNGGIRDYDLFYSVPGSPGGEEYLVARPRTGKGVQYAKEYGCGNHDWTANGQWDPASQDLVDPSVPVAGVNAPIVPQANPGAPPPLPPQYQPQPQSNWTRMDKPKQLQVDPELAQSIGTGSKGGKVFDDALDKLLAEAEANK